MYCSKCGYDNKNDNSFCESCGNKLINKQSVAKKQFKIPTINKKNIARAGIIAVAIVCICIGMNVYSNMRKTINMNKYINVSFEGYDGYGHAVAEIDWKRIKKDYGKRIKFQKNASQLTMLTYYDAMSVVESCVYVDTNKKKNLKNGDEITLKWHEQEAFIRDIDCNLKFKSEKITVSGLEEAEKYDFFEGFTVEFSGIEPGSQVAQFDYNGEYANRGDFKFDNYSDLKNGDIVTVKLRDPEKYVEEFGVVPEDEEKTYKVEGLRHYLGSVSELEDNKKKKYIANAEETIDSKFDYWNKYNGLGNVTTTTELINEYGLLQKSSEYGNGGVYGLIYKITNEGTYKNKKVTQVTYYIVDYYNISIDAEGKSKCSLKKQNVSYDSITFDGEIDFDYYGFLTLEEAQNAVIEKYSDYEVEWINHEQ